MSTSLDRLPTLATTGIGSLAGCLPLDRIARRAC